MSDELEALVVLVLAIWASVVATLKFSEVSNKIRDEIILGVHEGSPMGYDHRELKLYNDWLPTVAAGGAACLLYAAILCLLPYLVVMKQTLRVSLYFASVGPFIGFFFFVLGIKDYKFLRRSLDNTRKAR